MTVHQGSMKYFVPEYLRGHVKINYDKPKSYTCSLCSMSYTRINLVTRHLDRHKYETFSCHLCGKESTTKVSCKTHYKCNICMTSKFLLSSELSDHMTSCKRDHSNVSAKPGCSGTAKKRSPNHQSLSKKQSPSQSRPGKKRSVALHKTKKDKKI